MSVIFVDAVKGDIGVFHSPTPLGKQIIHVAGNEPAGRGAYHADAHPEKAALRHEVAVEYKNAFDDFGQFAVKDFAFHAASAQPGRYFEGGGE